MPPANYVKEEKKQLRYPGLVFVATQTLSFCKTKPDASLSPKVLLKDAEFL